MVKVSTEGQRPTEAAAPLVNARRVDGRSHFGSGEARAYGAASAKAFGIGSPTWQDVSPSLRTGWEGRHQVACDPRHDWRLCWPAVKDGWVDAGGAVDSPPLAAVTEASETERIAPAPGAYVFDAFGEPAGRVKRVRENDFLLGRPLARDVFVPLDAIRWPGRMTLRIGVPNAQVGALGWERPKILGLFGARRRERAGPPTST
jgi:hypothetical protein